MPWGRHQGGPISHNALQHYPECHGADTGGVPSQVQLGGTLLGEGYPAGGYPAQGVPYGGYPTGGTLLEGTLPGGTLLGRYPARGTLPGGYPGRVPPGQDRGTLPGGTLLGGTQVGYPPRPGQDGGGYSGRTTEGVFTTRREVCLLRSRRRTFLFNDDSTSTL